MQLVDILISMNNLHPDSNTGWMGGGEAVLTQLNSQTVTDKTTDRSQPVTSNNTTEYNLSNHRICYIYVMANKLYWKPWHKNKCNRNFLHRLKSH